MSIQLLLNLHPADVSINDKIEIMKDNQLLNGSFIFFALIIAGVIFTAYVKLDKGYKKNNFDVLYSIQDNSHLLTYYDFAELYKEDGEGFLYVDLRSEEDFKEYAVENSINIPAEQVFEKANLKKLKKYKEQIVLFSDNQSDVVLIYLMLQSIGYENIWVLSGSIDIFVNKLIEQNDISYYFYNNEKKRYNYKNYIKTKVPERVEPEPGPEMFRIQGGC